MSVVNYVPVRACVHVDLCTCVHTLQQGSAGQATTIGDFYRFNTENATWSVPSTSNPAARARFGMTATPDGTVYLWGGTGPAGECCGAVVLVRATMRAYVCDCEFIG